MQVLVVDVGGTHVKILATGHNAARELPFGPTLTAEQMVVGIKQLAADWQYDAVTIGYPEPVVNNRPLTDPWNLGGGVRAIPPLPERLVAIAKKKIKTMLKQTRTISRMFLLVAILRLLDWVAVARAQDAAQA